MADGGTVLVAWEEKIATNPVALSPLLLKRTGLLTVEVGAWCEQGCALVTALAQELKVVRPNIFDRRPCAAELLGKQLDALLALGLSSRAPANDGVTPAERFAVDFQSLLQALVGDFLDLSQREIELHVSSYMLRVEREEPDGCSEDFDALKARRDVQARALAKSEVQKLPLSRPAATTSSKLSGPFLRQWLLGLVETATEAPGEGSLQDELIPESEFHKVRGALATFTQAFERLRSEAVEGLKNRPAIAGRRGALTAELFDSTVTELVDRTLWLLRVEVLKDVLEANYRPSVETNPIRPEQVANALSAIKVPLLQLSGSALSDTLVEDYCKCMFKERRATVFHTLLMIGASETPPTPSVGKVAAARLPAVTRTPRATTLRARFFVQARRRAKEVMGTKAREAVENVVKELDRIARALEIRAARGRQNQAPLAPAPDGGKK